MAIITVDYLNPLLYQASLSTGFASTAPNWFTNIGTFHYLIKRQSCHHIETSHLICSANQLTGSYMMGTLAFNELKCAETDTTWPFQRERIVNCSRKKIEFSPVALPNLKMICKNQIFCNKNQKINVVPSFLWLLGSFEPSYFPASFRSSSRFGCSSMHL